MWPITLLVKWIQVGESYQNMYEYWYECRPTWVCVAHLNKYGQSKSFEKAIDMQINHVFFGLLRCTTVTVLCCGVYIKYFKNKFLS